MTLVSIGKKGEVMKAVLFDLDGTLVDSTAWHETALNCALQEVSGFQIGEFENRNTFSGKLTRDKLSILLEQGRISSEQVDIIPSLKKKYFDEILEGCGPPDLEKIRLLEEIKHKGLKLACVTNSNYSAAHAVLHSVGLSEYFDLMVTGSDVFKHKPCSEGYIIAMVELGVRPRNCVIVEDSAEGITSAHNTGAHVWRVWS